MDEILDLAKGIHQIEMDQDSIQKTAFSTDDIDDIVILSTFTRAYSIFKKKYSNVFANKISNYN